jgi:hypothetical protein
VERNNTINEFGDEFDAGMDGALRRYLKRVNAATDACASFDAELTNAYIENALGATARARFETHLGDCGVCRRHVVELFRLTPPEERPAPVIAEVAEAKKARWLAGLFDFHGWRWSAAAMAGACAVILLALGVSVIWQQSTMKRTSSDIAAAKAPRPEAGEIKVAASPVPAEALLKSGENQSPVPARPQGQQGQAREAEVRKQAPIPTPAVSPQLVNNSAPPPPAGGRDISSAIQQRANSLPSARPIDPSQIQSGPGSNSQNMQRQDFFRQSEAAEAQPQKAEVAAGKESAQAAAAQPTSDALSDAASAEKKTQANESRDRARPPGLYIPKPTPPPNALALRERERDDEKPKAKAAPQASGLAVAPRLGITKTVGNKTFRMEKGVWRDTSYNPEDKWPIVRLSRGSEEYDQTIVDIPSLRQFFTSLQGPVVVLWQGTVYQIR